MSDLDLASERCFVTSTAGVTELMSGRDWEKFVGFSPEMSLATDILFDANMLDAKRLKLLQAVEGRGDDPAAFARHIVKLSRALHNAK